MKMSTLGKMIATSPHIQTNI